MSYNWVGDNIYIYTVQNRNPKRISKGMGL